MRSRSFGSVDISAYQSLPDFTSFNFLEDFSMVPAGTLMPL
jgi:hypothetical protein